MQKVLLLTEAEVARLFGVTANRTEPPDPPPPDKPRDLDERLLYRIREVAVLLSISRSKAYELVRTGALPSVRIDGARRVAGSEVTAYIQSLRKAA